ncbi:MAG: hypothetical protein ACFFEJ_08325 [Candidatus Thorarchaeota archaeon]
MAGEILAEVANLIEDALQLHSSLRGVVLSTREGVVVASVSRDESMNPTLLSTVSAALVWASTTTLDNISGNKPTHLIHNAGVNRVLIVLLHQYQLVTVISRADDAGLQMRDLIESLQSIGTRIEILMRSTKSFGSGTILGMIVEAIPSVSRGMVLTLEGLPIGSIGFANDIEVAALAGSIFANGLTYSEATDTIVIGSKDINVIIQKLDEKRLLAVVVNVEDSEAIADRIKEIIQAGI